MYDFCRNVYGDRFEQCERVVSGPKHFFKCDNLEYEFELSEYGLLW